LLMYKRVIQNGLAADNSGESEKLKELVADRTELTIRVAELEDELAEARKPKRRTTRKKKDDTKDAS